MKHYDIAIVGGGWAGVCAAAAAARRQQNVILIERDNSLGGLASNGFIGGILGHGKGNGTSELLVRGEFERLLQRLHEAGGCPGPQNWGHPIIFNHDTLKIVMENYLQELGVTLLFRSSVSGATRNGDAISSLQINAAGHLTDLTADYYLDCTGNGDLLELAGADYEFGRPGDGLVQALGIVVLFVDVDSSWEKDADAIREALDEAHKSGKIAIYHGNVVAPETTWGHNDYSRTIIRVGGIRAAADPRDAASLSRAEKDMRQAATQIMEICRKISPAFAHASIIFPSQVGIRECRRLVGKATITEKDIAEGIVFPDAVATGLYWIDIHCPMGYTDSAFLCNASCKTTHPCRQREEFPHLLPQHLEPPKGKFLSIPLGALCSHNVSNLLAAGRCISTTSSALAAVRVMSICAATGEAAGAAAAFARNYGGLDALPVAELQADLRRLGATVPGLAVKA
jgi:glycine/D-amino acid oxidase-like deaminating enzyme